MEVSQTRRIEIVSYSKSWEADFQALGSNLRRIVGDTAIRIDHIGSTAVPGLCAKDKIDIQMTISSADQFAVVESLLGAHGFNRVMEITSDHVPIGNELDNTHWQKQFYRAREGTRPMNLHVRVLGKANQIYAVLFRDFLRSDKAAADLYGEFKMKLSQYCEEIDDYCTIKDPVCDLIMLAAQKWASENTWASPPGDS